LKHAAHQFARNYTALLGSRVVRKEFLCFVDVLTKQDTTGPLYSEISAAIGDYKKKHKT